MDKIRYETMLPHEFTARRKRCPAAFLGLGGIEWHSEHLAVGNDALKAERLCELAAERTGGFAFPTLWYGEPRVTGLMEVNHDPDGRIARKSGFRRRKFSPAYFGQTAEEQVAFYRALLRHVLIQLNTLEMRAVCLLCGHYPIKGWADPVVARFNGEFRDTQVFAGIESQYLPERCSRRGLVGADHAGKWETSYLWALRPECVDLSVYRGRAHESLTGVMGEDPRTGATLALGRRAVALIVEGMAKKAAELLRRAGWKK
jgi:creatinine amidohydrolase/Fe(II)-dependent formamide hydrolase-like protein